jgi:hypothetical protein
MGVFMDDDDRRLFVDSIAEMRGLKAELREFKEHVMGRIVRLERNEGKRGQFTVSVLGVLIAAGVLLLSILARFSK